VASHEHNLLPFGTPQYYPLLSAQSKAVSAANNKERLGESHEAVEQFDYPARALICYTEFGVLSDPLS
jgi:hypothetical protein